MPCMWHCFFLEQMYFNLDPEDLVLPNFQSSFLDFIRTIISGKTPTCSADFENLTQMAALRAHRKQT